MNDGSLQTGTKQFAFDLDSQKGVTILLASLRSAEISTAQKNELRDLVFLYSNGGKDESVRITIEQKITSYGIVPMVSLQAVQTPEPSAPAKPKLPFGTSRPAPSFTPSFKAATFEPVVDKPAPSVTPVPQPVVAHDPEPQPVEVVESVTKPISVMEPEEVIKADESFVSEIKPEPVFEPLPAPVSVPDSNPATSPQPIESETNPDSAKSLDRIRQIKSIVNDKVGNPVNLVDIDNEVGREYMGALLDAMKKINSGTSTISAMKRLEASFVEVQKTLEKHDKEKSESKDEPMSAPVAAPAPQPAAEPVEVPKPLPEPEPMLEIKSNPNPTFSSALPVETLSDDKNEQAFSLEVKPAVDFSLPKNPEPVKEEIEPLATFAPKIEKNEPKQSEKLTEALEDSRESAWANINAKEVDKPEPRIPIARVASLADIKNRPASIDNLKSSSAIETSSVSGDPLYTKQVDDGLNQLLQEWSIFKKSGLFGTGPKGSEHPLFKKICALQIPLLLAGRFEGATQEIKQSITDYMNGWRYEQGIIYEQGETFEHYLRRVIRHILDLQKNK